MESINTAREWDVFGKSNQSCEAKNTTALALSHSSGQIVVLTSRVSPRELEYYISNVEIELVCEEHEKEELHSSAEVMAEAAK